LIEGQQDVATLWNEPVFADFRNINVLALVYDEKKLQCNILIFNNDRAKDSVVKIEYVSSGKGRIHPIFRFFDGEGDYVCEVRYGTGTANALQRGFWTHTKNGHKYFDSLTDGWIDYSHNHVLVNLFSHALIATSNGHEAALIK